MKTPEERFWAKVNKTEDCWAWTSARTDRGYGAFCFQGRTVYAHRFSYEMTNGQIPQGLSIDHTCHNRSCIKPAHLRAVTNKQNHENRSGADANTRSGIRGVHVYRNGLWSVRVGHNGKLHNGGIFTDLEEARVAAVALRNSLFTHNDADKTESAQETK